MGCVQDGCCGIAPLRDRDEQTSWFEAWVSRILTYVHNMYDLGMGYGTLFYSVGQQYRSKYSDGNWMYLYTCEMRKKNGLFTLHHRPVCSCAVSIEVLRHCRRLPPTQVSAQHCPIRQIKAFSRLTKSLESLCCPRPAEIIRSRGPSYWNASPASRSRLLIFSRHRQPRICTE